MASVDYESAAVLVDPNASFGYVPFPKNYTDLVWMTTPIPQATLDAAYLANQKTAQITKISAAMQIQVTGGFLSDALVSGVFLKYDSDLQGQIAVVGAMTYLTPYLGITPPMLFTLSSVDPSTGIRSYAPHNYGQLYHLFGDLGTFSSGLIATLTDKITAIYSINTGNVSNDLDAVYAITWP